MLYPEKLFQLGANDSFFGARLIHRRLSSSIAAATINQDFPNDSGLFMWIHTISINSVPNAAQQVLDGVVLTASADLTDPCNVMGYQRENIVATNGVQARAFWSGLVILPPGYLLRASHTFSGAVANSVSFNFRAFLLPRGNLSFGG